MVSMKSMKTVESSPPRHQKQSSGEVDSASERRKKDPRGTNKRKGERKRLVHGFVCCGLIATTCRTLPRSLSISKITQIQSTITIR